MKYGPWMLAGLLGLAGCQTLQAIDARWAAAVRGEESPAPPALAVRRSVGLRSGPGTEFPLVRRLPPGERVVVRATVGHWRAVHAGREHGYVPARALAP